VETAIADINSRLNVLNKQFNAQLEAQKIERLKSSIYPLREQVNVMTLRLDTLGNSSDIDFSQEQEILTDINFQLDSLTQRLDHPPASFKVDPNEIEETLSGINFQLHALSLDLENLPDPIAAVDLRGGEEAIADINSQLNTLNQQFNTQTEAPNREQIEQEILQHQEQLNALELRLNGLCNLSEAELKKEKKAIANINLGLEALVLFLEEVPADSDIDLTEVVIALGEIKGEVNSYALHLDTLPTA
jgi:predicted  nucleic acid-binding Zn-ribbon protein